jgi:hypothetical protein
LLKVKVEPALTSEYYNFVAAKTDMSNVEFTKVNSLNADDIKYIENENWVICKSRTTDYAYNYATITELNVEGRNLTLHIIPFANVAYYNKAHVYIEDAGVISSDFLEISISDIDNGYNAKCTSIGTALVTERECEDGSISCDCDIGV